MHVQKSHKLIFKGFKTRGLNWRGMLTFWVDWCIYAKHESRVFLVSAGTEVSEIVNEILSHLDSLMHKIVPFISKFFFLLFVWFRFNYRNNFIITSSAFSLCRKILFWSQSCAMTWKQNVRSLVKWGRWSCSMWVFLTLEQGVKFTNTFLNWCYW